MSEGDVKKRPKRAKRRKGQLKPDTLTVRRLQAEGWLADIVERRLTFSVKKDFLGIGDVLALREFHGMDPPWLPEVLIVQACSDRDVMTRFDKLAAHPNTMLLIMAGCLVEVWAWGANDELRIERLTLDRLHPVPVASPPQ